MKLEKGKISIYQVFIIFLLGISTAGTRIIPRYVAIDAGSAGWLVPLIGILPVFAWILIFNSFFQTPGNECLSDVFRNTVGKGPAKALQILYLFGMLITVSLNTRFFAERMLSTVFVYMPKVFCLAVMLILVFLITRHKIDKFARLSEVMFALYLVVMVVLILLAVKSMDLTNFLPVSTDDILPVVSTTQYTFGLWCYFTYFMFCGKKFSEKETFKRRGIKVAIAFTVMMFIYYALPLGIFGAELNKTFSYPFFMLLKNISAFGSIERFESVFIAFWVIMDFTLICMLMYSLVSLIAETFNIEEKHEKHIVLPVVAVVGILCMVPFISRFALEGTAKDEAIIMNIALGGVIPLIIFIIHKIKLRKAKG